MRERDRELVREKAGNGRVRERKRDREREAEGNIESGDVVKEKASCLDNLGKRRRHCAVRKSLAHHEYLLSKPKDERSSRITDDLRPLNAQQNCNPPQFSLPTISGLMSLTLGGGCLTSSLNWTSRHTFTFFIAPARPPPGCNRSSVNYYPLVFEYRGLRWK